MKRSKMARKKIDGEIKVEVKWRYDQQPNPMWHKLWEMLLKSRLEPKDKNGVGDENR